MKKLKTVLLIGLASMLISTTAMAMEETKEFDTKSADESTYDAGFAQEIKQDGKTYKLKGVKYKRIAVTYPDREEQTVTRDDALKELEIDGKTFTLKSNESVTTTRKAVSKQRDFPKEKDGYTLQSVSPVAGGQRDKQIVITFYGEDGWGYEWNGHEFEADENGPLLGDFKEEFANSYGGSFKSIKWKGAARDGERDAVLTVTTGAAKGYEGIYAKTQQKCVYEYEGEPTYRIRATATYEKGSKKDEEQQAAKKKKDNGKSHTALFVVLGIAVLIAAAIAVRKKFKKPAERQGKNNQSKAKKPKTKPQPKTSTTKKE